jgi:hypothetical protein
MNQTRANGKATAAGLRAAQEGDDFEGRAGAAPMRHPGMQVLEVGALHALEASSEGRLAPAVDVRAAFRNPAAVAG